MKRKAIAIVLCFFLVACGTDSPATPELTIETYALSEAPQAEWTQLPFAESVEGDPRLKRAEERSQYFGDVTCIQEERYGICTKLGPDPLFAAEDYSDPRAGFVSLKRSGGEIYRISVGEASPVPALRGLWTYDGHWALETVLVNTQQDDNAVNSFAVGQITVDGELLNDQMGYEEAFGFQTIQGKPFYFFQKDGKIHANYDGEEIELGYDEIPHYNCCSASTLNPMIAQNMVVFFARQGFDWYYVEIGAFDQP